MKNEEYKKYYGILGLGQFGENATRDYESDGFTRIVANSSLEDLSQAKGAKNKIHLRGGSGCHKNRKKAKELLRDNVEILINEIKSKMPEITTLFIFASAAGGTGSGMLAATAKVLRNELGINICVVTVLPSKSEQFKAYANTVELFQELERLSDIGATFILDNDKHGNKLKINEIFFTHLSSLLANENGSEYGCIDRGEINEMLRTPGMAVISKLNRNNTDTEKLLASIKSNNIYAPLESNKVIRYFGLMSGENEVSTEKIYSELGTPVDEYLGTGAPSTVCMVVGMTYPKTRLNEIKKMAQANSEIIKKNMEAAKESLFDDELDFINAFESKEKMVKEEKVSSLDILAEFL